MAQQHVRNWYDCDAGDAGVVKIDLETGKRIVVRDDITIGGKVPFTLTRIFDPSTESLKFNTDAYLTDESYSAENPTPLTFSNNLGSQSNPKKLKLNTPDDGWDEFTEVMYYYDADGNRRFITDWTKLEKIDGRYRRGDNGEFYSTDGGVKRVVMHSFLSEDGREMMINDAMGYALKTYHSDICIEKDYHPIVNGFDQALEYTSYLGADRKCFTIGKTNSVNKKAINRLYYKAVNNQEFQFQDVKFERKNSPCVNDVEAVATLCPTEKELIANGDSSGSVIYEYNDHQKNDYARVCVQETYRSVYSALQDNYQYDKEQGSLPDDLYQAEKQYEAYFNQEQEFKVSIAILEETINYEKRKPYASQNPEEILQKESELRNLKRQQAKVTKYRDRAKDTLDALIKKYKSQPMHFLKDGDGTYGFDFAGRMVMYAVGEDGIYFVRDENGIWQGIADSDGNTLATVECEDNTFRAALNTKFVKKIVLNDGRTFVYKNHIADTDSNGFEVVDCDGAVSVYMFDPNTLQLTSATANGCGVRFEVKNGLPVANYLDRKVMITADGESMEGTVNTVRWEKFELETSAVPKCATVSDSEGNTVVYEIDANQNCTLLTQTNAKGMMTETLFDYDARHRVIKSKQTETREYIDYAAWQGYTPTNMSGELTSFVVYPMRELTQEILLTSYGKTAMQFACDYLQLKDVLTTVSATTYYEGETKETKSYEFAQSLQMRHKTFDFQFNEAFDKIMLKFTVQAATGMGIILDKISWTKSNVKECTYDYDDTYRYGSRLSSKTVYGKTTKYENYIEDKPRRVTVTDKFGYAITTDYEYMPDGKLLRARSDDGMITEYTYDEKGAQKSVATYHESDPTCVRFSGEEELPEAHGASVTEKAGAHIEHAGGTRDGRFASRSSSPDGVDNTVRRKYLAGKLAELSDNAGCKAQFGYDAKGNVTEVRREGETVATATFSEDAAHNRTSVYTPAAGERRTVTEDALGNETKRVWSDGATYTAEYNEFNRLKKETDSVSGEVRTYTYDADDFLRSATVTKNGAVRYSAEITRDPIPRNPNMRSAEEEDEAPTRVTALNYRFGVKNVAPEFAYSYGYRDGAHRYLESTVLPTGATAKLERDAFGRLTKRETTLASSQGGTAPMRVQERYAYYKDGDESYDRVAIETFRHRDKNGSQEENTRYSYDAAGNISKVTRGGYLLARYAYDACNRLVREENCGRRRTYTYEYDAGGNMTGKYEYPLTQGEPAAFEVSRKLMTYDAEHPDRMRSYGYERCEYDATGRPSVYRDHPCTWERGMLKTYSRNGIDTVYGYDAGGGRTSKTVTKQRDVVDGDGHTVKDEFGNPVTESYTVTTAYTYLGDKLIRQSDGADTLDFFYDDSGLRMINHNGTDYIVRKNIMGDVTHLYTTEGKMVGKYVYDAWGNPLRFCTSERVSQLNPILYRGYCYDPETRLYYLKTRYYDPEACRFISSDDENILLLTADHANGIMSYTYCANNPVIDTDSDGQMPNWIKWLLGGVIILGVAIATIATGGAAAGVAGFILAGALKGAIIGAVSGALISGTLGGISSAIAGDGFWSGFADGAADGFMGGAILGGITGAAGSAFKVGQAAKLWDKGNFKTGFRSMKYHYQKHVISEGFKAGNNIIKYTKDAINFSYRNASSLKFIVPYNTTLQPYWTFIGKVGMNGQFTSLGKILSFWYTAL